MQCLTKQVSFILPIKHSESHDWAACCFIKCKAGLWNLISPLLASRPCPFHVLKQSYVANPALFVITECPAPVKLSAPHAAHSAGIPGCSWDMSADRAVWLSEASPWSAWQQLRAPGGQAALSELGAGCSHSPSVSRSDTSVFLQTGFFPLFPNFCSCKELTWLGWKSNYLHQKSFGINI